MSNPILTVFDDAGNAIPIPGFGGSGGGGSEKEYFLQTDQITQSIDFTELNAKRVFIMISVKAEEDDNTKGLGFKINGTANVFSASTIPKNSTGFEVFCLSIELISVAGESYVTGFLTELGALDTISSGNIKNIIISINSNLKMYAIRLEGNNINSISINNVNGTFAIGSWVSFRTE